MSLKKYHTSICHSSTRCCQSSNTKKTKSSAKIRIIWEHTYPFHHQLVFCVYDKLIVKFLYSSGLQLTNIPTIYKLHSKNFIDCLIAFHNIMFMNNQDINTGHPMIHIYHLLFENFDCRFCLFTFTHDISCSDAQCIYLGNAHCAFFTLDVILNVWRH